MGETATAFRLLRAHLEAAAAILDGLIPEAPVPAPPDDELEEQPIACPHCGEKREEKLEDSTAADEGGHLVPRVTCLTCGKSFNPNAEEVAHG